MGIFSTITQKLGITSDQTVDEDLLQQLQRRGITDIGTGEAVVDPQAVRNRRLAPQTIRKEEETRQLPGPRMTREQQIASQTPKRDFVFRIQPPSKPADPKEQEEFKRTTLRPGPTRVLASLPERALKNVRFSLTEPQRISPIAQDTPVERARRFAQVDESAEQSAPLFQRFLANLNIGASREAAQTERSEARLARELLDQQLAQNEITQEEAQKLASGQSLDREMTETERFIQEQGQRDFERRMDVALGFVGGLENLGKRILRGAEKSLGRKLAQTEREAIETLSRKLAQQNKPIVEVTEEGVIFGARKGAQEAAETVKFPKQITGKARQSVQNEVQQLSRRADIETGAISIDTLPPRLQPRKISQPAKLLKTVEPIKDYQIKSIKYTQDNNPPFELPDETRLQYIRRQIQDKFNRIDITQKTIQKTGREISEEQNAYLQQELFHGRAAERIEQFRGKIYDKKKFSKKPLLQRMRDDNLSLEDIGNYLHAKHAPERNLRVAEINPEIQEGGSGLTNERAQEILSEFERSGKAEQLDKYAEEFYENVTRDRLRVLEESGLEKPETIETLRQAYKNYVPLKVAGKPQGATRGKGFSVAGANVQRVKGSLKDRTNPFVQALIDYEDTIIKAEKNKTAQALLRLAQENPNPDIWEVQKMQYTPRFNESGELITFDPKFKLKDNIVEARVDGERFLIELKDKAMAQAMKNLGSERGIAWLHAVNNYLRAVNTFFNPEFIITNFERDVQTALINVGGEQGLRAAKNVTKEIPSAMRGIWKNLKGDEQAEWSKLYKEMKEQGGRVGWFDQKTIEEKTNELLKAINLYNSKTTKARLGRVVNSVGQYVSDVNEVVESAVRLSAYKNAKTAGMTKSQAAQLAKNLTVNFNKKGNIGTALNSFYLFANAGVQGTARVFTALRHKKVRRIVAAITALSYGINELNDKINEKEYQKILQQTKDTNMIFMMPNGNYVKIKLPYGYNIFKVLGDSTHNLVNGKTTITDELKHLLLAADSAFNPLSSGSVTQMISPTITDPLVQQAENKNWFGGPIKPGQSTFGPKKRESALYFNTVRPQSKAITEWINDLTGGSEVEAGAIDISPEILDHYIDFLGGGVSRFFANTWATGVDISNKELPEVGNAPFLRQLIGKPFEAYEQNKVFGIRDKSATKELTQKELQTFKEMVREGLKSEKIDKKTAVRTIKDVIRNQAKIQAGQVYDDLKNATPEEKKQALKGMSELERKEFIKIIKENQ